MLVLGIKATRCKAAAFGAVFRRPFPSPPPDFSLGEGASVHRLLLLGG